MEKFEKKDVLDLLESNFNFLDDVGLGTADFCAFNYKEWKDPDAYSKKLYLCHEYLWNKSAERLNINLLLESNFDNKSDCILQDKDNSEIVYASDYIGPSAAYAKQKEVSNECIGCYLKRSRTLGGHLIWPKNPRDADYRAKISKGNTINQDRGSYLTLHDRIDLTLIDLQEYYEKKKTGILYKTFLRFEDFLDKFKTFEKFIDFFYLQDFMEKERNADGTYAVKELAPFQDIEKRHSTMPVNFQEYIDNNVEAIKARNKRIIEVLRKDL